MTYSDGSTLTTSGDPSIVTWSSSDETVMTVSETGAWSAIGSGDVTLTATATSDDPSYDGSVFAPITTTVLEVLPEYVTVLTTVPETVAVGETGQATASVHYNNGVNKRSDEHPEIVSWSSSDETLLTIDDNGNYEALAVGDVTVTATSTEIDTLSSSRAMTINVSYDFEMQIGTASYVNGGISHRVGLFGDDVGTMVAGEFPDGSAISCCTANLVRYNDSEQFSFYSDASSRWNDAEKITLTFTFDDDTELTTPALTFNDTRYVLIDEETEHTDIYYAIYAYSNHQAKVKVTRVLV